MRKARPIVPHKPGRYVVLHHTGVDPPHFDFMVELEPGEPLLTWRFPTWPADWKIGTVLGIEALGAHRNSYLKYQGPLSNNRGRVKRVESGPCLIASQGRKHKCYHIRLGGNRALWIGTARGKGISSSHVGPWGALLCGWRD